LTNSDLNLVKERFETLRANSLTQIGCGKWCEEEVVEGEEAEEREEEEDWG
jgi:hypothetical protein